jgi:hypothetical protein
MDRVRLLVAFSALAACVLGGTQIVAPKREAPTELDLQLARCTPGEAGCVIRTDRFADRRGGRAEEVE